VPSIVLVRHGQASFGGADYDVLSNTGHEQAAAVAAELRRRGLRPARVLSGGLTRQRDTAAPLAEALGAAVEVDERWDEYRSDDILAEHSASAARLAGGEPIDARGFQALLDEALHDWLAAGEDGPAGETWPAFAARTRAALDDVAGSLGSGETALVCTSGGVIATLGVALLGAPPPVFVALNRVVVNAALTRIAHGRSGTTLVSFNEHAHLEAAGRSLVTYR
jgi:broad specificity phosphatase PhoE